MTEKMANDTRPDDWFNQVCAALGLFDGARPVSPQSVLWSEVLPAIEALKANNPEAAIFIEENQRVHRLWADALTRMAQAHRRADGFLQRWNDLRQDHAMLLRSVSAPSAGAVGQTPSDPI